MPSDRTTDFKLPNKTKFLDENLGRINSQADGTTNAGIYMWNYNSGWYILRRSFSVIFAFNSWERF